MLIPPQTAHLSPYLIWFLFIYVSLCLDEMFLEGTVQDLQAELHTPKFMLKPSPPPLCAFSQCQAELDKIYSGVKSPVTLMCTYPFCLFCCFIHFTSVLETYRNFSFDLRRSEHLAISLDYSAN